MSEKRNTTEVALVVNGSNVHVDPDKHSSLLSCLRSELLLTGTKQGCASGNCGACNVMINGVPTQSCQTNLTAIDQSHIETIEKIVQTPLGKSITQALTQNDAAQCGYCLPGIVVAAYAEMLNAETPDPVHALQRNLCRCGTHSRILKALKNVMSTQDSRA